jgi:transcriptional regulator with XRE-family HTH domain/DNA-binding XRE family transcriptional regulator
VTDSTTPRSAPGDSFGERLRRLREAAGLSQVALAGDALHPSYVSLLEAGRRTPTPEAIATLASRLGVSPRELSGEIDVDLEQPIVLAEAALGLGRPQEALDLLEPYAARFTRERCAHDPLAFRAAHAYATALERRTRIDDAAAVLEVLRESADASPATLPWLAVTTALIRCYRDAGDVSRAIEIGEDAIQRCRGVLSVRVDAHAALVSTVAGTYSERGDLLRAQMLLDDLLDQVGGGEAPEAEAFACWNAAINAVERGRPKDGLRLAEQAAALLDAGGDARARARLQLSRAWVHLAQDPPEAAKARDLLRDALPQVRQYAGGAEIASADTELARCELILGRPEVARRHALAALKRLSPENRIERARALTTLGSALVALGETAAGVHSLDEAAQALEASEAPRAAAGVWRQLSTVFRALGDPARALDAADRALDGVGLPHEPVAAPAAPPTARPTRARKATTPSG